MRIIALPLTRPVRTRTTGHLNPKILVYYHFEIARQRKQREHALDDSKLQKSTDDATSRSWAPRDGWGKWVGNKATWMWSGFGKAKEGSWQLWLYRFGERIVDRMDFEELALKGIDPSLGPSLTHPDILGKESTHAEPSQYISLVYPPSELTDATSITHLRSTLAHHIPRHRQGLLTWMLISPLTFPFTIVPLIPNFPFFFCVWRSWSHYRAYRASQYLNSLLDHGAIHPRADAALDAVYRTHAPKINSNDPAVVGGPPSNDSEGSSRNNPSSKSTTTTAPSSESRPAPTSDLLLAPSAVPSIIQLYDLPASSEADLLRAVEQAKMRVSKGEV
ncbi:hypothetical protein FISHEDRAFT_67308 [Fistulina hepatica ATCC 64428]|uniref:Mitochondrial K+-H+ exchange-related-domain-containing protein n=1 Tax=Fistulina hepatica ATCC 64428 TaxID=1128425 RepID=A0A0D7A2Z4_9AGAR|nr:hypothetical protein FISHEDRAFT_67308 [Fistulina hepatica ATCC 64428]